MVDHSHAPVVVDHSHLIHAHVPHVVPGPATYQAITRGAVHTAPLEGHSVSQTSLNLEPAPGTL